MKNPRTAWLKSLATCTAIGISTLALVDAVLYFFLPANIARQFVGYRLWDSDLEPPGNPSSYPRDYFMAHPTRGFDLRPGARGTHTVDGFSYPVWVNRLGCFDGEWDGVPENYYYWAGDSHAWGYAPFEEKFASRFQQQTGIPAVSCGVTHTGQRHQFDKFLEVTGKLGRMPSNVIVTYNTNDIANDNAYPHSTVVDGWLADNVLLDAETYDRVPIAREWIAEQIARRLAAPKAAPLPDTYRNMLLRYSISVQVGRAGAKQAIRWLMPDLIPNPPPPPVGPVYYGQQMRPIYQLENVHMEGGEILYAGNRFTEANRRAIEQWQRHAQESGYKLTFVLMAYPTLHGGKGPYASVKSFLDALGIQHIDLFEEFGRIGARANDVYWPADGHMSPRGNAIVADILLKSALNPSR